jgi:hypothetical protein
MYELAVIYGDTNDFWTFKRKITKGKVRSGKYKIYLKVGVFYEKFAKIYK